MTVRISPTILAKLKERHQVEQQEVEQCFENITGLPLRDTRERHDTDPPTLWFIARTNRKRLLKVCFVPRGADQFLRTAYPPNDEEIQLYKAKGKPTDF